MTASQRPAPDASQHTNPMLALGVHVVIATFAEDGPLKCSGLPVMRYSAAQLQAEFGDDFTMLAHDREQHATPFGTTQAFTYCHFQLASTAIEAA